MKHSDNLDDLLESFLSDSQVEDQGFSNQVMNALPQEPRWLWITDFSTVLGLVVGALVAWSLGVITPAHITRGVWSAWNWIQTVSFSTSISVSVVVALGAVALAFAWEKFQEV